MYEKKNIIKGNFGAGITAKGKKEALGNMCMGVNITFPLLWKIKKECEKR